MQQFVARMARLFSASVLAVLLAAGPVRAGQLQWQQQRTKLKAFDTLSERHYSSENAKALKLEQKLQDEFASRAKGKPGKDL